MKFEPTYESVSQHQVPEWFNDAKFGIFIHWGLFAVPAWAYSVEGKNIRDIHEETDEFEGQKYNPYAEWYQNSLRIEGSPTQEYHKKTYGEDFKYADFQKSFEEQSAKMNPKEWSELFKKAGAKYVVMVTKHHDGYCLWPSDYKNPFDEKFQSSRDLVGELTEAVRQDGMKMGLYYSGIFDWTFKKNPMNSAKKWLEHYLPTDEYAQYSLDQTLELIHKYKPSVLWNDMGYPAQCDLDALLAEYYNEVPEGVTDDRWIQRRLDGKSLDEYAAELVKKGEITRLDDGIHGDYDSPEYVEIHEVPARKWESCRGLGMSFGYNQVEKAANFMTGKQVVYFLADIVSKNGNLLLNVGPRADGTIQEEQVKPLLETGAWLEVNGEAIYGTTYWEKQQESVTSQGKQVRYTKKGTDIYAIVLDDTPKREVTILNLVIPEDATLVTLQQKEELEWCQDGTNLKVKLPEKFKAGIAYTIKIS